MTGRSSMFRWVPLVLVVLVSVGVGMLAYNAGLARGLASSAQAGGAAPMVWPGYWFHPFGFVFPLFFLFFWFAAARFLFWGGPWRRRWHYAPTQGVPPMFEEWHRQAHERTKTEDAGHN